MEAIRVRRVVGRRVRGKQLVSACFGAFSSRPLEGYDLNLTLICMFTTDSEDESGADVDDSDERTERELEKVALVRSSPV